VTVHERVAEARHRLREAGLSADESDLSARLLAEHVLGWTTERFLVDAIEPEPAGFADRYGRLVARRAAREPLPYIVGAREFWGLAFEVTPDVLIPRPETELIVEAALQLWPDRDAGFSAVDVCTGSGCVAIAIACERPNARMTASDISAAALAVAQRNAARHGVSARVEVVRADMLDGLAGPFDLVTANPPYVRAGDRRGLQPEVRTEPDVALFSGDDGLDAIRRLVAAAPERMAPGAHLVFEFGLGQDSEIEQLLDEAARLELLELRRDLQGIARTAVARRV